MWRQRCWSLISFSVRLALLETMPSPGSLWKASDYQESCPLLRFAPCEFWELLRYYCSQVNTCMALRHCLRTEQLLHIVWRALSGQFPPAKLSPSVFYPGSSLSVGLCSCLMEAVPGSAALLETPSSVEKHRRQAFPLVFLLLQMTGLCRLLPNVLQLLLSVQFVVDMSGESFSLQLLHQSLSMVTPNVLSMNTLHAVFRCLQCLLHWLSSTPLINTCPLGRVWELTTLTITSIFDAI